MTLRDDVARRCESIIESPALGAPQREADAILALVRERLLSDAAVEAGVRSKSVSPELCEPSSTECSHIRAALTAAFDAVEGK